MTLARRQLRLNAIAALSPLADAGVTIVSPADWTTPDYDLPAVIIRAGRERKVQSACTMPNFTTTALLEIQVRVSAATGEAAQDGLEALNALVEDTLLGNRDFVAGIQRVAYFDSESDISAEGDKHVGATDMAIACEVFEVFDQTELRPDDFEYLESVGVHFDSINIFDAAGTYPAPTEPEYTPDPAPRTGGPDGRDEGALDLDLTI